MKRFLAVAAAAATTLPMLLVAGATSASAADCRSQYSQGRFILRLSPTYALVERDSVVRISTRLVRGNQECGPNERVGFYTRGRGGNNFVLAAAQAVNSRGLTSVGFTARDDFRYYTNFNINAVTPGARSSVGLVQVED